MSEVDQEKIPNLDTPYYIPIIMGSIVHYYYQVKSYSSLQGFFLSRIILFSGGNSRQIDPVPCGAIDEFHHGEIATIQSPNYPRWKTV